MPNIRSDELLPNRNSSLLLVVSLNWSDNDEKFNKNFTVCFGRNCFNYPNNKFWSCVKFKTHKLSGLNSIAKLQSIMQ